MSTDSNSTLTDLDVALTEAQADASRGNSFYDTFLNTEIFVPALRADKKPGEWEKISLQERFFPLYLRHEEDRIIPVFDRLERLKAWSQDKTFNYLALRSHILLRVIASEIAILLNEGTPYRYLFTTEILELLRSQMKPVQPQ